MMPIFSSKSNDRFRTIWFKFDINLTKIIYWSFKWIFINVLLNVLSPLPMKYPCKIQVNPSSMELQGTTNHNLVFNWMNFVFPVTFPDSKVYGDNMGAHLGPTGPRLAQCWSHEPWYLASYLEAWICPGNKDPQIDIDKTLIWHFDIDLMLSKTICSIYCWKYIVHHVFRWYNKQFHD